MLAALALALVLAPAACRTISAALPANQRKAEIANRFAVLFWSEGDDTEIDRLMSFRLKQMMRVSALRALRDGQIRDLGNVVRVGPAYYEDSFVDYKRFRVPVEFTRTTVDLRVVIDESQLVSQFFIVDHLPPP